MPIQRRNTLKSWFETGDYPTQDQFWDWQDSFFHLLEDKLPIDNVDGLRKLLNEKADIDAINSHLLNQSNPHQVTKAQVGLGNLPNAKSDAIDQDNAEQLATSAAIYKLHQLLTSIGNQTESVTFLNDGTYQLQRDQLLETIVVSAEQAFTLSIGTTSGASDILPPIDISADKSAVITLQLYADQAQFPLYFSGINARTTVKFYKR